MTPSPEIVILPARTFAGLQARFISAASPDANNMQVIPRLWEAFFARAHEIRSTEPGVFYGLCDCGAAIGETIAHPDEVFYLAAAPIAPDTPVPGRMTTWESPAGTYARFIHRGRVERIGETIGTIYGTWLREGTYVSEPGPDLERYTRDFDPQSDASTMEIFVPVQKSPAHPCPPPPP